MIPTSPPRRSRDSRNGPPGPLVRQGRAHGCGRCAEGPWICNPDHHGIALVRPLQEPATKTNLNHVAFEVTTLYEVVRVYDHSRRHGAQIAFAGRCRAGASKMRSPTRCGQDTMLHDPSLLKD
jgi:hypothetical protein